MRARVGGRNLPAARPAVRLDWHAADGERLVADAGALRDRGPARAMLTGERTRAQLPADAVGHRHRHAPLRRRGRRHRAAASSTRARRCPACAPRRSTPCAAAAAHNHRIGLYDGVLIKENHIVAAGSIAGAIAGRAPHAPGHPGRSRSRDRSAELERGARRAAPTSSCWTSSRSTDMRAAVASATCARPAGQARGLGQRVAGDGARDRRDRRRLHLGRRADQARARHRPVDAAGVRAG